MLESDESSLNDETTSVFRMIEEQTKATYATLTTLQPLSPAPSDRTDGYCRTRTGSFADLFDDGFSYRHGNIDDLTLAGYEFLEPLVPTAVFDGDALDCDLPPAATTLAPCSLFARTSFLTPTKRERFDRSLTCIGGYDQSSLVSSRASSPESSYGMSPHNGTSSSSPSTLAKLAHALTTILTTEDFEAFMDAEKVDTRDIAELVLVLFFSSKAV